mmetsp:Transcript_20139/g.22405  ORF Transcript_20139/g.22405 Transcript_20139/m.22405 type:complete len:162 (+) Transcript_20139:232-717(+)
MNIVASLAKKNDIKVIFCQPQTSQESYPFHLMTWWGTQHLARRWEKEFWTYLPMMIPCEDGDTHFDKVKALMSVYGQDIRMHFEYVRRGRSISLMLFPMFKIEKLKNDLEKIMSQCRDIGITKILNMHSSNLSEASIDNFEEKESLREVYVKKNILNIPHE